MTEGKYQYEYSEDFTPTELRKAVESGPTPSYYFRGGSRRWDKPANFVAKDDVIVDGMGNDDYGVEDFDLEGGYVPGIGWFDVVSSWNNGDGHETGYVIKHQETGRLFARVGWYSSWDSTDWDGDFYEVEETKVTVSRYTSKNGKTVFNDPDKRN